MDLAPRRPPSLAGRLSLPRPPVFVNEIVAGALEAGNQSHPQGHETVARCLASPAVRPRFGAARFIPPLTGVGKDLEPSGSNCLINKDGDRARGRQKVKAGACRLDVDRRCAVPRRSSDGRAACSATCRTGARGHTAGGVGSYRSRIGGNRRLRRGEGLCQGTTFAPCQPLTRLVGQSRSSPKRPLGQGRSRQQTEGADCQHALPVVTRSPGPDGRTMPVPAGAGGRPTGPPAGIPYPSPFLRECPDRRLVQLAMSFRIWPRLASIGSLALIGSKKRPFASIR